jgi:hypothetical protein
MKPNSSRWSQIFVMAAVFSISAVVQLDAQSVCGKNAGYSHAAVPSDGTSAGRGHPDIGSLPPNTALENIKVSTSLTDSLEKSGMSMPEGDLKSACSGFKDLSQCIAAIHVAKNLNLLFGDLQGKMTGSNSINLDKKHTKQDLNMAEPRA